MQRNTDMPYLNIGEADRQSSFLTGLDGSDKAILQRIVDAPSATLNDDEWQRLIYLVDAAPALFKQLTDIVAWLSRATFNQTSDEAEALTHLLYNSRITLDRVSSEIH